MINDEVALQDEFPLYNYDAYFFLNVGAQALSVESGWIVPFLLLLWCRLLKPMRVRSLAGFAFLLLLLLVHCIDMAKTHSFEDFLELGKELGRTGESLIAFAREREDVRRKYELELAARGKEERATEEHMRS